MKKQTGIWLDVRHAWIVNLPVEHEDEVIMEQISSHVEEHPAFENTRMDTSWGPHGGNNQKTVEERQHHEEKQYFEKILKHLHAKTDELVIFGPSEAKHGLKNLLEKQHQVPEVIWVESADQMTEYQMQAWVHDYFKRPAPRKTPGVGGVHEG